MVVREQRKGGFRSGSSLLIEAGIDAPDPHRAMIRFADASALFSAAINSVAEDPEFGPDVDEGDWPDQKQIIAFQRLLTREETKKILQLVWENDFLRKLRPNVREFSVREGARDLTKHGIATLLAEDATSYDEVHRYRILVLRILEALEHFDLVQIDKVRANRSLVFGTEKLNALMTYVANEMDEIFAEKEIHFTSKFRS